jgi:hypothetical protein
MEEQKMKLNLGERILLLSILPKEGNFATLKILRDLQNILSPSEEEYKKFEIKQENGRFSWNNEGVKEKEIKIGEKATDLAIESLKKLDEEKKLTQNHFSLYKKFVMGE